MVCSWRSVSCEHIAKPAKVWTWQRRQGDEKTKLKENGSSKDRWDELRWDEMVFYFIFLYFILFLFCFPSSWYRYIHTLFLFCSFAQFLFCWSIHVPFTNWCSESYVWTREDGRAVLVCLEICPSSPVLENFVKSNSSYHIYFFFLSKALSALCSLFLSSMLSNFISFWNSSMKINFMILVN